MSRSYLVYVALQLQPRHDLLERPALRQTVIIAPGPAITARTSAAAAAAFSRCPPRPPQLFQRFLGSAVVGKEIDAAARRNLERGDAKGVIWEGSVKE